MPAKKKTEDIASKILWVTKRTHKRFRDLRDFPEETTERLLNRILDFYEESRNAEETKN